MIAKFDGQLEIDTERGVVYFHSSQTGHTLLRICRLPTPIPVTDDLLCFLDITHMHGVSWNNKMKHQEEKEKEEKIKKCIVFGCENKTMGDLCELCREMLTTGKVSNNVRRTFIHEMDNRLNNLLTLAGDIRSRINRGL